VGMHYGSDGEAGEGCIRGDASRERCRIWHAEGDAYVTTHRWRYAEYGMREGMHTGVRIAGEMPNMACRRGCIRGYASWERWPKVSTTERMHTGGDAYGSTHRGRDAEYGMQEGMHTGVRITGEMA
jgi:hypothetical protein